MNSGVDSLHKILKDEIRRKIILLLREKQNLSYTQLLEALKITSTGKLNYHLKVLGDLVSKAENGGYVLTEKGVLASQLLLKFSEQTSNKSRLNMSDAVLIGLAGFLLVFINPFVWGIVVGGVLVFGFIGVILYAIFVPALVMWRLATNRTKSHDFYELFKPAIVPALLFALLFILLFALNRPIVGFMLPAFLFLGFAPFIGIALIETFRRNIRHL